MKFLSKSAFRHRPKNKAVAVYLGPESIEIVHLSRTAGGIAKLKAVSKEILNNKRTGKFQFTKGP